MKIRNSFLIIFLITFISLGLVSFKNKDCVDDGTILNFNSLKCGGCWGWTIKIGTDTIKTGYLPIDWNIIQLLKYPQKVKINIGEREVNQHSRDYEYYDVKCIELITEQKCSKIVWYRFIGGKPDMNSVRISESVAKKWGFTIHYEYGSCGNTENDKRKSKECEEKNKEALNCLIEKYGEDWQDKFFEQVKKEM